MLTIHSVSSLVMEKIMKLNSGLVICRGIPLHTQPRWHRKLQFRDFHLITRKLSSARIGSRFPRFCPTFVIFSGGLRWLTRSLKVDLISLRWICVLHNFNVRFNLSVCQQTTTNKDGGMFISMFVLITVLFWTLLFNFKRPRFN